MKLVEKSVICFILALPLSPLTMFRVFESVDFIHIFVFSLIITLFCCMVNKPDPSSECISLISSLIIAVLVSEYFPLPGRDYLFVLFMSCFVAHTAAFSFLYAILLSFPIGLAALFMPNFDYLSMLMLLFTPLFYFIRHVTFYAINYFFIPTRTLIDRQIKILLSLLLFYFVIIVFFSLWHNFLWIQDCENYKINLELNRSDLELFLTYTGMLFSHGTVYAVEPISRSAIILSTVTMIAGMLVNVLYAGVVIAYVVSWRERRNH